MLSLGSQTSNPSRPVFTEEDDDEGIDEETTELFGQRMLQQGQWRVKFLDEAWQLAKKCLFSVPDLPKRIKKHPTLHSYIVPSNVVPKKITRMISDGSCLFRALSFAFAEEYIESVRMDVPTTWGGSTELEVAARWLRTPIKVYFCGNPKFPPKSWITYGDLPNLHNTHTILLSWTNGDHYDYVSELL